MPGLPLLPGFELLDYGNVPARCEPLTKFCYSALILRPVIVGDAEADGATRC
jgi:hypothetical protein